MSHAIHVIRSAVRMAAVLALAASLGGAGAAGSPAAANAALSVQSPQVRGSVAGNVNEPARLAPTPELIRRLNLPEGFRIAPFASRLEAPRMIAVHTNGDVYVTRRAPHHDVLLLRDGDGDGRAEVVRAVAEIRNVHGIALRGGRAYLANNRSLYVADILPDGGLGAPRALYSDLPDGGQHPNRTMRFSPDGRLLLSVGSTNNSAGDPNPENATILAVAPDGSGRRIFAKGLRNTIGFDWHPVTRELWGMDHGIDWLGDHEQREELNLLVEGGDYGWPYIYDDQQFNRKEDPQEQTGLTFEEYAARTAPPVLGLTPHSAPMDMVFYTGTQFPAFYRGQAFLALHGSWNRARPVGYKVVRIFFRDGMPVHVANFLTGFLQSGPQGDAQFGRPCGLAVARDGSLLVTDDSGGVVYRIWHDAASP